MVQARGSLRGEGMVGSVKTDGTSGKQNEWVTKLKRLHCDKLKTANKITRFTSI